jgi:SAM-dependent methyltransferase
MSQAVADATEARSTSEVHSIPPGPALMQMLLGGIIAPMIGAAVELGVIPELASEPRTSRDVALTCGTPHDTMHRLLRGLSAVGVVCEHADGRFSLTPIGACLLPNVAGSFDGLARLNGSEWCGVAYRGLADAVRTGQSAFTRHHGEGIFRWLAKHPAEQEVFARAMSTFSGLEVGWVLAAYDFSDSTHIVDIGGGHGMLLSRILQQVPNAKGTLFDVPDVIETAPTQLLSEVRERCDLVAGDFFNQVPERGDLYILKHILHDWDDAAAQAILRQVSRAMRPGGRVLVIEQGIAPPGIPNPGKVMDVVMMALVDGGRERTSEEHAALMHKAGLRFEREISTPGNITLFVGTR